MRRWMQKNLQRPRVLPGWLSVEVQAQQASSVPSNPLLVCDCWHIPGHDVRHLLSVAVCLQTAWLCATYRMDPQPTLVSSILCYGMTSARKKRWGDMHPVCYAHPDWGCLCPLHPCFCACSINCRSYACLPLLLFGEQSIDHQK